MSENSCECCRSIFLLMAVVARREFFGQEVVAVPVRSGPAEHEGELRVSVRPGLHPFGAQGRPFSLRLHMYFLGVLREVTWLPRFR
jgi:hypothetical protein